MRTRLAFSLPKGAAVADNSFDVSPSDRDLWIRTVIGEAGTDPASQPAVAHVIANRIRDTGQSPSQVVLAPNQFEPWNNRSRELLSASPTSAPYKAVAKVVDGVISGSIPDPTNGATQFYAPAAQKALGRKPPAWDDGTGVQIGAHKFFGGSPKASQIGGVSDDDLLQKYMGAPATPHAAQPAPDDEALLQKYMGPAAATASPAAIAGTLGQGGLIWDAAGGRDPQTGALVVAGKPFSEVPKSQTVAALSGALSGIPIVGPSLVSGVQKLAALASGAPPDQAESAFKDITQKSALAYPGTTTAANIAGAVGGTIPAMMAAPAAFGAGGGGLLLNSALSGMTGAGISAADTAARQGLDIPAIERSAGTGALFGAAAPGAARLAGAGIGALGNAFTGAGVGARNLANVFQDIGLTPLQAQSELQRLGPAATLADVNPALTTEAGGLASIGGAPTSILKTAMATRAAGANSAAHDLMNATIGPAPDAEGTLQAIQADAQSRAAPHYAAGRSGTPMDVTPVLNDINSQIGSASGGIKSLLQRVKSDLIDDVATKSAPAGTIVPKSDPQAILGARQALDDVMYNRDTGDAKLGPNAMRVAGNLRNQIDNIVKTNSDFANGDAIYSQSMGIKQAFKDGQDIFSKSMRPEDLQRRLATATPEEATALRQGARAAIEDAMEKSPRGEGPAAQGMFAKSSNNRANLDALFPNGQAALDALHAEGTMRATEQRVAQNSATAERQAVHQKYAPATGGGASGIVLPLIGEAAYGGPGAAGGFIASKLVESAKNALTAGARARLTESTARGLASTGSAQQDFMNQLSRAYSVGPRVNALAGGVGNITNLLTRTLGPAATNALLPQFNR